jgi:squalene-hopene/tetraprenyl-beta-curcumene cyclase
MNRRAAAIASVLVLGVLMGRGQAQDAPKVTLVASKPPAGGLSPSLGNEVDAAIDRGLTWLAANQKPDGSWSNGDFPALTALPLWAFARSSRQGSQPAVSNAVKYILSCARENGGIYREVAGKKGGGLGNYNTAICMTALHATGDPALRPVVLKARKFVAGAQYFGDDTYKGGFGYDQTTQRPYTDLLNTYYSAEAMKLTASAEDSRTPGEARVDIDWNETVKFVERMQNKPGSGEENAGGFVYNPSDPKAGATTNAAGAVVLRSYGSITYAGLLTLLHANVGRDDVRVRSALDWARKHWSVEENPGMGTQGLFFFYNVLTKALDAAGPDYIDRPDGSQVNWREEVAKKIVKMQRIDAKTGQGYWVNENGRFWENDPVLATAYNLLALEMLK